ncbi:MAG: N-acetyl-alpha-D-glucosaminyl L-malate synthase BshA [bacterium]|nr:N-acetyl-alpha-D-glucosaminyl L-malate synthase BshA [bacterium]
MKIGIVCYPTYGGSGIVATELGMALAKRGHEIHFISYQQPQRLTLFSPNIVYHEVAIEEYPLFDHYPYTLALAVKMVEVAQTAGLDLLHVHYAIPHSISALLANEMLTTKIPFITTLHGTDITIVGSNPSFLPIVKLGIEKSSRVTAVSYYLKEETYKTFQVSKEIDVIYNFVDGNEFKPLQEQEKNRSSPFQNVPVIAHLSNFRPVKRLNDVVEVFRKVRNQLPVKLLFIGDGPERYRIEQMLKDSQLYEDTLFVGKQQAIPDLLAVADLLLLPSETESFGLAALEAMSCEVPVLAYHVGGLPEVVDEGSGFLLPYGDVNGLAEKALFLLKNPQIRKEMGKQARISALNRFSMEKIVNQYEQYYTALFQNYNT